MSKLKRFTLNANQIKIIALVVMTIDHIGAFMFELPIVAEHYFILRIIGRIAAPLFLYVVIESIRHTSNRPRLVLRLYIANLMVVAIKIVSTTFFSSFIGASQVGNIFQTFLVAALVICMIDLFVKAQRDRDKKALLQGGMLALLLILPVLIFYGMTSLIFPYSTLATIETNGAFNAIMALFPCILIVEYTPLFVLLGVIWYYGRNRIVQVVFFIALALLSKSNVLADVQYLDVFSGVFQHWMILAAPFILLYNGKKGGSMKYFFYVYYIIHPYILIAIVRLLT